jgi:hypothetical protein
MTCWFNADRQPYCRRMFLQRITTLVDLEQRRELAQAVARSGLGAIIKPDEIWQITPKVLRR